MTPIRSLLLHCYYGLHSPWRALVNARRAAQGKAPIFVLCFHRIADDRATEWTQSNQSFVEQIRWIKRHFEMISLEETQRRLATGHNCRPAVSVTFDDGYAENCDVALPLLIEEEIPCTYFVTGQNVLGGVPFAHDLHAGRRLTVNTISQLRTMAEAGIEIGNHSKTHPNFGLIKNEAQLYTEVIEAGQELAAAVGAPVRYFAFPYGYPANLNSKVYRLAKQHGYAGVCSAYGGFNFPGEDTFHIQRIPTDRELIRLKNWLTVDPRKLRAIRRFQVRWDNDRTLALGGVC
jgi:peptidoglycan/xylan/chitin deacetylase (PgdA/CDA1 family)